MKLYEWRIFMNDKKKLLIAGGDLRQIYCGKYLADRFDVSFAGFERQYIPENLKMLSECGKSGCIFDYIVFPIPPIKDKSYINTPFSDENLSLDFIRKYSDSNTLIFCGKSDEEFQKFFKENDVFDYMERDELNILNAVPTAEGAVYTALEELPVTLSRSRILITGFGRIGKALANILKGFGADITVMTRSADSRAWAKAMNLKVCSKSDIDSSYNIIFNTAPVLIFNHDILKKLGNETVLIDLASKPGGVDFRSAGELGIKVIWALGLPGKTAPVTAGEIVAETIENIINERSDNYE